MRSFLTPLVFLLLIPILHAQSPTPTYTPDWASIDSRPTPEWWRDAKFGIFIHWGVYSVPAFTPKGRYSEWYLHSLTENDQDGSLQRFHQLNFPNKSYYDLADQFTASQFDPDAWAQLFELAGARYVVLTSKHHDGFCLWPNETASKTWGFPWNAAARGPKKDLIGDLFKALRKTSVRPGLYYSLYEWYNPIWKQDKARYANEHMLPQLYELVNKYAPEVVWADGDWDASPDTWKSKEFLAWLYNQSPVRDRVVANDRWGSGVRFHHAGIYTPEYQPELDFEGHDWEESRGMGFSYGYNRAEDAWDYNSSQTLILHLIDKVSRGGNFLLDIGPDAYGQIPPIMQERLTDIGQWLSANGEAIYHTRRWRQDCQWSEGRRDFTTEKADGWKTGGDALLKQTIYPEPGFAVKEVFFTHNPKTNNLYALLPVYPISKKLLLKGLTLPSTSTVTLLSTNESLRFENGKEGVTIHFPDYHPSKIKANQAFAVKITGFGAYLDAPSVQVNYDPQSMKPTVVMRAAPGASIRYTTDGSEPTGASTLYSAPFQPEKSMQIRAKAFQPNLLESKEASATANQYALFPALTFIRPPQPGLLAQLKASDKYSIETLESCSTLVAGIVDQFSLDPMCAGKCGMTWQGYLNVDQTTGYQFATESDDGSMLYIDGQLIVNNGGDHGLQEKSGLVYLQRGWHNIKVLYFNNGGDAQLKVKMAPVGSPLQALPAGGFAH